MGVCRRNCVGCLSVLGKVLLGALVAPVMWLSVALLNGTFYECALSGTDEPFVVSWFCQNHTSTCKEELPKVPCKTANLPSAESNGLLLMLRAQSQVSKKIINVINCLV